MSERVVDKYATRGATLVHQVVLLEEERQPLPDNPSPGLLVTRVSERLIRASCAIECDPDEQDDAPLQVAVFLIGAAGFALTAIAHLQGQSDELTRCKDALLEELDTEVAKKVAVSEAILAQESLSDLVHECFELILGACESVGQLEGMRVMPADEEGRAELTIDELLAQVEAGCDDSGDGDELDQVAEFLWETAVAAAAAGQLLLEQHESR